MAAEFVNTVMKLWVRYEAVKFLTSSDYFDVLVTVHLSIILVINQLNAQNLVLK